MCPCPSPCPAPGLQSAERGRRTQARGKQRTAWADRGCLGFVHPLPSSVTWPSMAGAGEPDAGLALMGCVPMSLHKQGLLWLLTAKCWVQASSVLELNILCNCRSWSLPLRSPKTNSKVWGWDSSASHMARAAPQAQSALSAGVAWPPPRAWARPAAARLS